MTNSKKKWLLIVAALVLFPAVFLLIRKNLKVADIRTEPAKKQTLTITVTATSTGTIKADDEARITARRAGRITKIRFDEGDIIKADEVVAELDKDEAGLTLLKAEAAMQKTEHMLSQLKAGLDAFSVEVERNIDKARATLSEAESRAKRYAVLKEKEFISAMDLEAAQKEYSLAKATLDSALASREQIKAKTGEIKAQEAAVAEAKNQQQLARLNYDYSFIRSPISGVLTSRPVTVGEGIQNGGLVAAIVSPESLYIEAFIDEADVAKVRKGQQVNVTMDAYQGKIFKGEVYKISPVVLGSKQETRTFEVRIKFKENAAVVKPGMSADVEIIVDSIENALVVPSHAVIEKDGKKFVYVARNSKAEYLHVETGRFNWNFTEIKSGIREGDLAITTPDAAGLSQGVRVRQK